MYTHAVDIYGIGHILYELVTAHRVYQSSEDPSRMLHHIPQLSYIRSPLSRNTPLPLSPSQYASLVVAPPFDHIDDQVRAQLKVFWDSVRAMKLTNKALLGEVNCGYEARIIEINILLNALLHFNPSMRPTIEVLEHHFRANLIRSMLEINVVCIWFYVTNIFRTTEKQLLKP